MIGLYALIVMAVLLGMCMGMVVSGIVAEWGEANGLVELEQGEKHGQGKQTD
mgnify:CR=1 FL=1